MGALFSSGDADWQPGAQAEDGGEDAIEDLTIPDVQQKRGTENPHTVFIIRVKVRGQLAHQVYRRYSFFVLLHAKLKQRITTAGIEGVSLPPLPGKKVFGNAKAAFVEKRRAELEQYLQNIRRTPMRSCPDFFSFLNISGQMLGAAAGNTSQDGFNWAMRTGGNNWASPVPNSRIGSPGTG